MCAGASANKKHKPFDRSRHTHTEESPIVTHNGYDERSFERADDLLRNAAQCYATRHCVGANADLQVRRMRIISPNDELVCMLFDGRRVANEATGC